ncbi:MAG: hypothetical protein JW910_09145 [Anaerolineae bacterium]|nr:hypothetical protein [Anaerolineae bacterium]
MSDLLFNPAVALIVYVVLAGGLYGLGRLLAGPGRANSVKTSTYASGEAPPTQLAAPGYRPFFAIALFFAILHLGVLVLGTSDLSPVVGVYLAGLMLALVALILG